VVSVTPLRRRGSRRPPLPPEPKRPAWISPDEHTMLIELATVTDAEGRWQRGVRYDVARRQLRKIGWSNAQLKGRTAKVDEETRTDAYIARVRAAQQEDEP
jgi:hypothetical protein